MSVNKVSKDTGELVTLANGTRMWIGTKSAHDLAVQQGTMPNNCMVCITDDAAGEEAWEYSTSETNTGKKWIDGKPIYRKVITMTTPSSGLYTSTDYVSNFDTIVSISGVFTSSQDAIVRPLPFTNYSTMNDIVCVTVDETGHAVIDAGSSWFGKTKNQKIIIEYTKTTD